MSNNHNPRLDPIIEQMYQKGATQIEISTTLNVDWRVVHAVLVNCGALVSRKVGRPTGIAPSILDGEDQNKIRMAIWRRQREGARARLREMEA